jgi:hypothetical protein
MTKRLVLALGVCLLSVACGGGGGGGEDDCAKVGDHWHSCDPSTSASTVAANCRAYDCSGDKAAALKCMLAIEGCSESSKADANACLSAEGCPTIP